MKPEEYEKEQITPEEVDKLFEDFIYAIGVIRAYEEYCTRIGKKEESTEFVKKYCADFVKELNNADSDEEPVFIQVNIHKKEGIIN